MDLQARRMSLVGWGRNGLECQRCIIRKVAIILCRKIETTLFESVPIITAGVGEMHIYGWDVESIQKILGWNGGRKRDEKYIAAVLKIISSYFGRGVV